MVTDFKNVLGWHWIQFDDKKNCAKHLLGIIIIQNKHWMNHNELNVRKQRRHLKHSYAHTQRYERTNGMHMHTLHIHTHIQTYASLIYIPLPAAIRFPPTHTHTQIFHTSMYMCTLRFLSCFFFLIIITIIPLFSTLLSLTHTHAYAFYCIFLEFVLYHNIINCI